MAEPLVSEYQHQPHTSNGAGADAVPEERSPDRPPGAEQPAPEDDSRRQPRAAPPGGRPGQEGDGGLEPQPSPLQTQDCPEPSCLEADDKGQNGEDVSAVGAVPPPAGGEQRPEAEPPTQPRPDSEANKLGARAAGGEEPWKQQQQQQQRQLGKKKHRRRPSKKKRIWKPYYKLTWEEKRKFDEKQSLRASRVRAEMFAKGQPVAPYNTTQFLMDDHDQEEPDLKTGFYPKRAAAKSDTSDEEFMEEAGEEDGGSDGMGGDGSEFLQRDFSETYERYHAESLQNMSKQELIREYLELEKCLSRMEDENNRLRLESKRLGGGDDARVRELELELARLRAENLQLLSENELRRQQERAPLAAFGD
ncbi:protein HEXIM1 [Pipistrellus kuhlii]|uniref:HEXIM P-TEFb complex subunit 1 n=1 Tax=Pipistrellus kuhlii TaxID=59472 RepID=A0A7J7U807_PIPKU|nr:protein HEXIM1 [Pipistrellus kuhlii]KAF6308993.1 HEXIM P-TEFb complex subunit 1 [Pipistrellus kuhlii]